MRELDGDLTDEQLSAWQQQQHVAGSSSSSSTEQGQESQQQAEKELALLTFVRAGAFGKLCQVRCWSWQRGPTPQRLDELLQLAHPRYYRSTPLSLLAKYQ
jgi:hypothetical protein